MDPEAAAAWSLKHPKALEPEVIASLLGPWIQRDPERAAAWTLSSLQGTARIRSMKNCFQTWIN